MSELRKAVELVKTFLVFLFVAVLLTALTYWAAAWLMGRSFL